MQTTSNTKRTLSHQQIVNGAWNFSYSLLWNNKQFNETEIALAKEMLSSYFRKADKPVQAFVEFCERVQLAFQYINLKAGRYASHPLKWLNEHYEHGLNGTKEWHEDLIHERTYIPIHRFELLVMAEAYVRYTAQPTKEVYQLGKMAILHYEQGEILQAYNDAILNYQYL